MRQTFPNIAEARTAARKIMGIVTAHYNESMEHCTEYRVFEHDADVAEDWIVFDAVEEQKVREMVLNNTVGKEFDGPACQRCNDVVPTNIRGLCGGCEDDVTLEGGCNA